MINVDAGLKSRVQEHFKGWYGSQAPKVAQGEAAALQALERQNGHVTERALDAWLGLAFPEGNHHGGTVNAQSAERMLNAFVQADNASTAKSTLGHASMRLGAGAQLLRMQKASGPWTDNIDKSLVPARVESFKADMEWLATVDLNSREGYLEAVHYCGWSEPEKYEPAGFNYTLRGLIAGKLATRHGLPAAVIQDALEELAEKGDSARGRGFYELQAKWAPHVEETANRIAVFEAFMDENNDVANQVRYREADEDTVRDDFEKQLGLEKGTIDPRVFHHFLDGQRGRGRYTAEAAMKPTAAGYHAVFYQEYVKAQSLD